MAWKINNHNESMMAEINITPLTDVMLVLLVIFMVTTPLIMTESFKIKLPRAVTSDAEPGRGAIVAVSADGVINLNGRAVALSDLSSELKRGFEAGGDKTVVVKADGDARHSLIVKILDTAKLSGAERLSIATERE
ncbi:MAG: biopolymer transporter ExbD [Deltaproteobacteria bacterium]|nr:biopolymer transporter ExbD [Deltaproteobacteria bacterium]